MKKKNRQAPDDFKGPRPAEEISFDVTVCSPEFQEGCKEPAEEQLDKVENKKKDER